MTTQSTVGVDMNVQDLSADLAAMTSIDELLDVYAELSKKLDAYKEEFEEREQTLKHWMEQVDISIQKLMNTQGMQSITDSRGRNVHWTTSYKSSIGDPVAFYEMLAGLLKEGHPPTAVFSALQRRPAKEFIDSWMESHDGQIPPGVNYFPERKLRYRLK